MPGLKGRRKSGAISASRPACYEGLVWGIAIVLLLLPITEVEALEVEARLVASRSEAGNMGLVHLSRWVFN